MGKVWCNVQAETAFHISSCLDGTTQVNLVKAATMLWVCPQKNIMATVLGIYSECKANIASTNDTDFQSTCSLISHVSLIIGAKELDGSHRKKLLGHDVALLWIVWSLTNETECIMSVILRHLYN